MKRRASWIAARGNAGNESLANTARSISLCKINNGRPNTASADALRARLMLALGARLPKAEAMDWSPGPEMNSVAVLLAHIVGVLHEGMDIALGDPPGRVRAQEFQTRGVLSAEMLRRLDAVIDYARGALPRLVLEDLDKERKDEDGTITCSWALLHALEHAYLHLGHVQLTCQMWRQRET